MIIATTNQPKHVDLVVAIHHRSVSAHFHRVGKVRERAESAAGSVAIKLPAKAQLVL
jgi:hypothetical protein